MPDSKIPPLALAFAGFVLALKPESPTSAVVFCAACLLFGFLKWLEREQAQELTTVRNEIKSLKERVETHLVQRGFNR